MDRTKSPSNDSIASAGECPALPEAQETRVEHPTSSERSYTLSADASDSRAQTVIFNDGSLAPTTSLKNPVDPNGSLIKSSPLSITYTPEPKNTAAGPQGGDPIAGKYDSVTGITTYQGDGGDDYISAGQGPNRILAQNSGSDSIVGGSGRNTIDGGSGNDVIDLNGSNDLVSLGTGYNTLNGGTGQDSIYAHGGTSIINGNGGTDLIFGGNGTNQIYADSQTGLATAIADASSGSATGQQGDLLSVGDGDDTLVSRYKADYVRGDRTAEARNREGRDAVLQGLRGRWLRAFLVAFLVILRVPMSHAATLSDCINRKVSFDGIVRLHYATVTATSGSRLYLHESFPGHCAPGNQSTCAPHAYLIPGNAVAIGKECGAWDYVQYIGKKVVSKGWVDSRALTLIPPQPPPKPPIIKIGNQVFPPPPPRRYQFELTRGKGTPVCEAYLQRLNQTEFYSPPYCGRPESTLVPGFALLHRRYLNTAEYMELFSNATGNPLYTYFTHKSSNGSITRTRVPSAPVYQGFAPGAWTYEPPVNIENSASGDNLVMWTEDNRYFSQCGGPDTRSGAPLRGDVSALIVSADRRIDRKETYAVFGMRNAAHAERPLISEFADEFGVFRYRDLNYFDTFLDKGYDFSGGPQFRWSRRISRTLAIFLADHGKRREMCEYHVSGLRTHP